MKGLKEQIFNTIVSLRNGTKQPNEDTIYCILLLNKERLQETLNKLVNSEKVKVKLRNGKIPFT